IDLNENDGGYITGITPEPIYGAIHVFKYRQLHKLVPTGDVTAPYFPYVVSSAVGCICDKSISMATDDRGLPALYFAAENGPWRLSQYGLEYCGFDLKDLWETVNLNASKLVCFGEYFPEKQQYWLWVATGTANEPNLAFVLDTRHAKSTGDRGVRGGWSVYDGRVAAARCAALFSNTLGATMSKDLKLYVGENGANNKILKTDTTDEDDAGTFFRGWWLSKPFRAADGMFFKAFDPVLEAQSQDHTVISIEMVRDYDKERRQQFQPLETCDQVHRVIRKFDGLALAGCTVLQL